MLRPPKADPVLENADIFADWAELNALDEGRTSKIPLRDFLKDLTLFADDAQAEAFTEAVWSHLAARQTRLRDAYPFNLEGNVLRRRVPSIENAAAYAFLLLSDLGQHYRRVNLAANARTRYGRHLEKVAEAAFQGIFRGDSVRFGVPRDPGWPRGVRRCLHELGRRLAIEPQRVEKLVRAQEKDCGLDVVARLSFGDHGHGSLFVLAQCAVGEHYDRKRLEPSLDRWREFFIWNGQCVRAVVVPWTHPKDDYALEAKKFEAMLIDRPRLALGNPDEHLDQAWRAELTRWVGDRLREVKASHVRPRPRGRGSARQGRGRRRR